MNAYPDDRELLGRYAGQGSEQAFTELVQRHLDFVFAVALREVHEPAAAADVAQAVFILLARKAGSVPARASLAGWLFQAVRHVARNARRAAWRRARHEREAALMNNPASTGESDSDWDRLAPVLNDALASLSNGDRDVVTLRFFENKSHTDIAAALGVPEVSARKRLSRAVERLRRFLVGRGVTVTTAALAAALMTPSAGAAPPGLAGAVSAAALAKGAGASASVGVLVKAGLGALGWARWKLAASLGAALAMVMGGVTLGWVADQQGERAGKFLFTDIQFTNRFVAAGWGGDVVTPDGQPYLFVRTRQERRVVEAWTRGIVGLTGGKPPPSPVVFQVEDERGDSIQGAFLLRASVTAYSQEDLWEISFFPRRGSNLWLRLYDRNLIRLAEVRVPNPALAAHVEWAPEPLPVTRADGDLSVRLEEFVTRVTNTGGTGAPPRRVTTLSYSLAEGSRLVSAWMVRSLVIRDATGNVWEETRPATVSLPGPGGRFETRPYRPLWPGEPAWQVELTFLRTNDFAAADVLALPELVIPEANQTFSLGTRHLLNGQPVRLTSLSGPQPGSESDPKRPPGHLVLRLDLPVVSDDWRPGLVDIRDEAGRPWAVTDYQRSGKSVRFHLHGPAGAQRLTLRLARQEMRRVEFVVRPSSGGP